MDLAAPKGIELWKKKTAILFLASSCFCFLESSTVGRPLGEGRGNNKDGQVLPFRPLNIHGRAIFLTLCFSIGDYGAVWFFFFFHHSSLLTQFSSLITLHLKYPNFLYPPVWHTSLNFSSLKFFYFFVGPIPVNWSIPSIKPTCKTHSPPFSLFSFFLHPCYSLSSPYTLYH